jgi:pimeloyl-ACP methyl ester carboxylesterase
MTLGDPTRRVPPSAPRDRSLARALGPARATWRFDVSDAVPFPGDSTIAVDVVVPRDLPAGAESSVLVCLPGGFLSRRYYDLDPGGDGHYSFAEAMAARGFVVLAFDHLGTGDSSKPDPLEAGSSFGVETVARANQLALERALERLAQGDPERAIPPTRCRATIGVGHSMGSALTVEQQALARPHDALVLFSFTTRGVPAFLNEDQRRYANDPVRARRELGQLAQRSFGSPYPARANDSKANRRAAFGVGTAPPAAEELLHAASTDLLGLGGLLSMIPGGYAPSAAEIDVPVYVLVGDHDLHTVQGLRDELPKAPVVATRTLEDCWHCHFVANSRATIWREIPAWIDDVLRR